MSSWGDGVARSWTDFYTRGLPPEAGERRREEIRSDLFEHGTAEGRTPAQQIHVLGRVLWGIPADLSWRRAARAPRERRLATGETMTLQKTMSVTAIAVIVIYAWFALGFAVGGYVGALFPFVGAVVVGLALRQRQEAPRRTTVMFVIGAFLGVPGAYWMAPLLIPFWLGFSWLAIASEPGRRQPVPAAT